jgi:hypothetical protein
MMFDNITLLKEQKMLKDGWASENKEPKYAAMTLGISTAPKAFEKVKTILTRVRGKTDIPLAYVIRHQLRVEGNDDPTLLS